MSQFKSILDGTIRNLTSGQPLSVAVIPDYSDPQTLDEVGQAIVTRLGKIPGALCTRVRYIPTEALFDVNHGGLELAKRTFAPETRRAPRQLTLVNVAKIDHTLDEKGGSNGRAVSGVRDDRILLGFTPEEGLIITFSDHGSPVLGPVLPHLAAVAEFHPSNEDLRVLADLNFRSRDFLPWIVQRVLQGDPGTLDSLEFVPVGEAAEHFEIIPLDSSLAWFVDEFGRGSNNGVNVKTGFSVDEALAAGLHFGDSIEIVFDGGKPVRGRFAQSCSRLDQYQVGLVGSSSKIAYPGKPEVQLLDIMLKGGKCWPLFENSAYKTEYLTNGDNVKVPLETKQPIGIFRDGQLILGRSTRKLTPTHETVTVG
jgi:hypothetical protein